MSYGLSFLDGGIAPRVSWTEQTKTAVDWSFPQGSAQKPALSNISYVSATGGGAPGIDVELNELKVPIAKASDTQLVIGSVRFTLGGVQHVDRAGRVLKNIDASTGAGTDVGQIDMTNGVATLTNWTGITNPTGTLDAGLQQFGDSLVTQTFFRAPVSPIRPGAFSIAATLYDGTVITATADTNGIINSSRIVGKVDYESGVAKVYFGRKTNPKVGETAVDLSSEISGVTTWYPDGVYAATIRFSVVSYTYLPLDADILGIDPVRLPTDGRVPIFRPGEVAVIHHTDSVGPVNVSNGQTINCARTRLARVRVIGTNGLTITSGYTADLDAGTVTFTDVTGYSQPVTVENRIEDMALVSEAQINGQLSFTRQLSHDFPANESIVSSALIIGDMRARVSEFFDQATWTGVWSDALIGGAAAAGYNDVLYPVEVTNAGAITERWLIQFTNTTTFNVIGEHVGQIFTGTVGADLAPINPAAGVPYFTIQSEGWGGGWSAGNCVRFNTVGALASVWIARTIQQGPATENADAFTVLVRGDVDRP